MAPGIFRLQHASLLFRSSAGTGVLCDPVVGLSDFTWLQPQALPSVDAVLISHSHGDHFSPLTLMQLPRDTVLIVPVVSQPSMLCPNMAALLRDAGFINVIEAAWNTTVVIKDILIHVLPFYGEQPWVTFGAPIGALRNHGNTYIVEMDHRKSWVLVDSGREFGHSMLEVAEEVRRNVGDIDVVLSNLRSFPWHPWQIDNSGRYLFCFPTTRFSDPATWPMGALITFGPAGMREFLDVLKPHIFLPYAHWWHGPEDRNHVVDSAVSEAELLSAIGDAKPGVTTTKLQGWQVTRRRRRTFTTGAIGSYSPRRRNDGPPLSTAQKREGS
jgi:L-ascorbate metabolism protein UlaG (beta-lactamase superfamily)